MMRTTRRTLIAATVLLLAAGAVTSCKSVAGAGGVAGLTGGRFINTTPKARADVGAVTWNHD
jgi:hypothetical protein